MMKLHVFNPEHDLALAADLSNFTAPHAGRQLRADLGFLPAIWADDDDVVLVGNTEDAERCYRQLLHRPFGRFVVKEQLSELPLTGVDAWGWDKAVCSELMRYGVSQSLMPKELRMIRELSHRSIAMEILSHLQGDGIVGEAVMSYPHGVAGLLAKWGKIVVKAPWSSSGRGVRFFDKCMTPQDRGWIENVAKRQGCVMVEPYYAKVKDFGMEFWYDGQGHASYLGLSLFQTSNAAYTGNILADEEFKEEYIIRYIPIDLLHSVREKICMLASVNFRHFYQGPFGVDMMVVARDDCNGFMLHPCVEINLRRTMGHVALSLSNLVDGLPKVMQIEYNNVYKIKLKRLCGLNDR